MASGTDVLTGAGTFTGITSLVSDDWTASGSYLYQNNLSLNVGIGNNAPQFKLQVGTDANRSFNVAANGYTYVRFDDNNVVPVFNIENRGMTLTGHGVIQSFNLATGGTAGIASGQIRVSSEDTYAAAANRDAQMSFATISNGSLAERVWIKSDGNVGINTSSAGEKLVVNGNIMYNSIRSVETVQTAYTNVTTKRYHVSTKYQGTTRSSIALDMAIMEELCADEDGCKIRFLMKRWDSNAYGNTAASREATFFYDIPSGYYRLDFPTGDGSMAVDGDNAQTHIYTYWGCRFSDYAHISNNPQTDNSRGLTLLAWTENGTNANKTCEMVVED